MQITFEYFEHLAKQITNSKQILKLHSYFGLE